METFQAGAVGPLDLQMSIPGNPYVSFANLLRPLALSEGRLRSQAAPVSTLAGQSLSQQHRMG